MKSYIPKGNEPEDFSLILGEHKSFLNNEISFMIVIIYHDTSLNVIVVFFKSYNEIVFSDKNKYAIVMPKLQNLPVTTREPVSDAKARELLLPSSSWGSHRY